MFEKSCFILLTSQCNLKCAHCYNMLDPNKAILAEEEDRLNIQQLSFLFTELVKSGYSKVLFSGGEALLRNDIFEIIKEAKNKGLKTALFTNGHMLTENVITKLGEVGLNEIRISFNEMVWIKNREQYEKVFEKQVKPLSKLINVGISVGYVYIVSGLNIEYTYESFVRLNELGASMKIQPLYIPKSFEEFNEVSASTIPVLKWEELKKKFLNDEIFEKENKENAVYGARDEIIKYIDFLKYTYSSCKSPEFCPTGPILVLDSNGLFHPCLFRYDIVCGDISNKEDIINIDAKLNEHKKLCQAQCYKEECLSAFR